MFHCWKNIKSEYNFSYFRRLSAWYRVIIWMVRHTRMRIIIIILITIGSIANEWRDVDASYAHKRTRLPYELFTYSHCGTSARTTIKSTRPTIVSCFLRENNKNARFDDDATNEFCKKRIPIFVLFGFLFCSSKLGILMPSRSPLFRNSHVELCLAKNQLSVSVNKRKLLPANVS